MAPPNVTGVSCGSSRINSFQPLGLTCRVLLPIIAYIMFLCVTYSFHIRLDGRVPANSVVSVMTRQHAQNTNCELGQLGLRCFCCKFLPHQHAWSLELFCPMFSYASGSYVDPGNCSSGSSWCRLSANDQTRAVHRLITRCAPCARIIAFHLVCFRRATDSPK